MQMTEPKVWCWEAARAGHGPDWRLLAVFDPQGEGTLDRLAARAALPGYTYCGAVETPCTYHQQACHTHTFVDTPNAKAYQHNLKGDEQTNLWIYNTVQIHRGVVDIECGYGGRGAGHNEVETAFLLGLITAPTLVVQHWSILAGGNGYDFRTLAEGAGADSFRAYLGLT
jgi:hypothetical protein